MDLQFGGASRVKIQPDLREAANDDIFMDLATTVNGSGTQRAIGIKLDMTDTLNGNGGFDLISLGTDGTERFIIECTPAEKYRF